MAKEPTSDGLQPKSFFRSLWKPLEAWPRGLVEAAPRRAGQWQAGGAAHVVTLPVASLLNGLNLEMG